MTFPQNLPMALVTSVLLGMLAVGGCASEASPSGSSDATVAEHAAAQAPAVAEVTLEVGHCWVEPVEFDGQTWRLRWTRQFGWGGGLPEPWQGTGVMTRLAEDRAGYVDNAGAELTFLPADDPAAQPPTPSYCA